MATIEKPSVYPAPGEHGSPVGIKERYENFFGRHWVAPSNGEYRDNPAPAMGKPFKQVAHSSPDDIELALDAAHAAKDAWGETSVTERAAILNEIADAMESHLEMLAVAESWENGKPVRETIAADLPLVIDHFRYFAGVIRGEEWAILVSPARKRGSSFTRISAADNSREKRGLGDG
jgi:aldehyde dehydrogenase